METVTLIGIFLGGLGIGVLLSFFLLERYYQLLIVIKNKLDNFKAEGEGGQWLK